MNTPWPLCLLLAAGLACGPAPGQEAQPDETSDPPEDILSDPPDDLIDALAGYEEMDFRLRQPQLLPEGSFLPPTRGTLVRTPEGNRVMVFHRDAEGRVLRPIILLPCTVLERMEEVAREAEDRPAFIVSGQLYVYQGQNFLLPTTFRPVDPATLSPPETPEPDPEDPAPPTPDPRPAGQEPPADEPADELERAVREEEARFEALIRDLETGREQPRALFASPAAQERDEARAAPALAEGTIISRRRARLVRQAAAWVLVFDNGPGGAGLRPASDPGGAGSQPARVPGGASSQPARTGAPHRPDGGAQGEAEGGTDPRPAPDPSQATPPADGEGQGKAPAEAGPARTGAAPSPRPDQPIILLPCLQLSRMEFLALRDGDAAVFEVSGRVFTYRGRNHMIPTMFQVVRTGEVRPLQ